MSEVLLGDVQLTIPQLSDSGGWRFLTPETQTLGVVRTEYLLSSSNGTAGKGPVVVVSRRRYVPGLRPVEPERDKHALETEIHAESVLGIFSKTPARIESCGLTVWLYRNFGAGAAVSVPTASGEPAVIVVGAYPDDSVADGEIDLDFAADVFAAVLGDAHDALGIRLSICAGNQLLREAIKSALSQFQPDNPA